MRDVNDVNGKELKEAIKGLNAILPKDQQINMFGMTKVDMFKAFADKTEYIAQNLTDLVEKIPQEVVNFYNINVSESAKTEEPTAEAVTKAAEGAPAGGEAKPKKEKKVKEPKPAKEKKPQVERTKYGHAVNAEAGKIDIALIAGGTIDSIMESLGLRRARIKSHMYHLKRVKNVNVSYDETTGVYKIVDTPAAQ